MEGQVVKANKTNPLRRTISEAAHRLLAEGRCTVEDVADSVMHEHHDTVQAEAQNLIYDQIKDVVKQLLRTLSEDDDDPGAQQALPGLKLPTVIAVKREETGEYEYVRADQANWDDLIAGLAEREQNIVRATIRRDQYRAELDRLRPWMASDPGCTVADALRMERGA
jgi:hypothetical protein